MTGVYLKCDKCGATLGVEAIPWLKAQHVSWGNKRDLQEYARELGWTGPLDSMMYVPPDQWGKDRCPECSKE